VQDGSYERRLMKIVTGEEVAPTLQNNQSLLLELASIVLSVDTSLLYLINDPTDPVMVWGKLAGQFEKKTWAQTPLRMENHHRHIG